MTTALPYAIPAPPTADAKPPRLRSLDAFRGATIVGMILVNNPGSWAKGMRYAPLDHAEWNGCTPTDWIFPFFLFIVGVAIPFSQGKLAARSRSALTLGILRRSAILFGLGIMLGLIPYSSTTGFFNLGGLRIPGVLQRIAVCYLVAATLAVFLSWRGMIAAGVALLAIFSGLMLLVPAPGFAAGDLSKEGNLAHYIDQSVFGRHGYGAYNDPEGLLSTLPAIGTVICGWLVGRWLRSDRTQTEKISAVFAFGVIGVVAGEILHHVLMPINKQIWTPSYVIHTAGLACLGLGLCYWIIDIRGYQKWARPLVACGMNAITIFFLAGLIGRLMNAKVISAVAENGEAAKQAIKPWLYQTLFTPHLSPLNASLVWALVFVGLFIGLAMVMDRMRVYLKV